METCKPFATFAYYNIGNGRVSLSVNVDNDLISVGVAYCSPNDQFSKSRGRAIALGRRIKNVPRYSFSFKRNDQRFGEQLFDEFKKFADTEVCIGVDDKGQDCFANTAPRWVERSLPASE